MTELILPNVKYKDTFIEGVEEFVAKKEKEGIEALNYLNNFAAYIQKLNNNSKGIGLKEDYVPSTDLWLVDGDKYIGRLSIRHELNDKLRRFGGHIGYAIRPSERGKGYGNKILELGLTYAKELGIKHILLTCDETNIASKKIIEKLGGKLEDKINIEGHKTPTLRYWIDLK